MIRKALPYLPLLGVALLTACATTTGLSPTESRSGFDGGRVVDIQGHGNACERMVCTGLGAQWTSTQPGQAILSVYVFNDIKGITGAQLAIDGQISRISPLPGLTKFPNDGLGMRVSRQDFAVSLATIRTIVAAQRAWLRVNTTDGYIEDAIIDGAKDSKAFHALRRFLAQIDAPA